MEHSKNFEKVKGYFQKKLWNESRGLQRMNSKKSQEKIIGHERKSRRPKRIKI